MTAKKLLIILLYILMLACCFGVVRLLYHLSGSGGRPGHIQEATPSEPFIPSTPSVPDEAAKETETATPSEATPSVPLKPEWKRAKKQQVQEVSEEPEPYRLPSIILATDVHYFSPSMTDYGKAFQKKLSEDDGKVLPYLPQLLEAFMDEVIEQRPSALVLSGDLTFNGEKVNHQELAQKLKRVQDSGIPVLVIPGNHDINNTHAASYFGDEKVAVERITQDEFSEIYHEYGYDQAFSRDENSLSYMYRLDDYNWMMMLDTCQYTPENLVGGYLSQETYAWMRQQLDAAARQDIRVIPVGHHNLLPESRLYPTDCAIEGHQQLIGTLENWKAPLYLSGHLHLQRIRKHKAEPGVPDEAYGIYEAVTSSLSILPFQYGVLKWTEERGMIYTTKSVDVSAWAVKKGITDENLLNFEVYSMELMDQSIGNQIEERISTTLPKEQLTSMAYLYSVLNRDYCAGNKISVKEVYETPAYFYWERNLPDTRQFREIELILSDIRDGGMDCNHLELPGTGYTLNPPKEVICE